MPAANRDVIDAAAAILGARAQRSAPLGTRTTYRVGGPAALLLEVVDEADLMAARRAVEATGIAVVVVGRGSNLLVADQGFDGLAVVVGEAQGNLDIDVASGRVRAGAGLSLPVLARRTAAAGLAGLEWAVGVPGSVGGAVRMNAGGHGSDMAANLVGYGFVDLAGGDDGWFEATRLDFGYRHSSVQATHVVTAAEFALDLGDAAASEAAIADIVRWRREHQPGGQNAGSVFTNPPGDSAGRLVEESGGGELRRGSATVSPRHANFVQADPGGSADDVLALIREVQQRVKEKTGTGLCLELQLVGFETAGSSGEGLPGPEGP